MYCMVSVLITPVSLNVLLYTIVTGVNSLFIMCVYLHSLNGVGVDVSLLDKICVLHVLCESL